MMWWDIYILITLLQTSLHLMFINDITVMSSSQNSKLVFAT